MILLNFKVSLLYFSVKSGRPQQKRYVPKSAENYLSNKKKCEALAAVFAPGRSVKDCELARKKWKLEDIHPSGCTGSPTVG